ncbi:hypothetical protein OB919_03920 [Halobacteria archaeon AArc-curdl1]|uniref:C2H2-type domain-containing protein n=1 Tax=Natronosalvus hydrolyticus TaxID=2979988 RepID=A0AAP3E686_9EURY|nr:hypothetical protein [Halobacteria archaeon AArc-curdl1]
MATKSELYCKICKKTISSTDTLKHHLVKEHRQPELAKCLASQWEAEELGDPK